MRKLLFFLLFLSSVVSANENIKITGVEGNIKKNVELYLNKDHLMNVGNKSFSIETIKVNVKNALNAVGYYNSNIKVNIIRNQIDVEIELGKPIILQQLDFSLLSNKKTPNFINNIIKRSKLERGVILNQKFYEKLKEKIIEKSISKGYFDAKFIIHKLYISPSLNEAIVKLKLSLGKLYKFGLTDFKGSQINESILKNLLDYKQNSPLTIKSLNNTTNNLSLTNWFSSVEIERKLTKSDKNGVVPITILLSPATKNFLTTGIGYDSDSGLYAKINWFKPWLNADGDSFNLNTYINTNEPEVSASYRMPSKGNPLNIYNEFSTSLSYVGTHDTISKNASFGFNRYQKLSTFYNIAYGINFYYENYKQASIYSDIAKFFVPSITLTRSTKGNKFRLDSGNSEQITVEYTNPSIGNIPSFTRITSTNTFVQKLNKAQRLILSINGGYIITDNINRVPPSFSFFLGGGNSIRGFDYQSISPQAINGKQVGGKYQFYTRTEYQHKIFNKWWGGIFYDYGSSWSSKKNLRWYRGIGPVIIRNTRFGDFSLYIGHGLGTNEIHFYFSLGVSL
ncbi:hypothetical protein CF386_04215 [Paraphotobacterium marinum]|uniref:Translocation and assembly module subunit TamA n=1 Tax=Paraphotobacterium marinum TaxID=1755811 RepID=A0A220VD01_9GAMM|nr:autotransporter assembly complex family protein [Paraphotobacterium marinum]ASK78274.1 hypothetical protein CF386_04215 [Paraphotobacterium marinum]